MFWFSNSDNSTHQAKTNKKICGVMGIFYLFIFFCGQQWNMWHMYTQLLEPDKIPHT